MRRSACYHGADRFRELYILQIEEVVSSTSVVALRRLNTHCRGTSSFLGDAFSAISSEIYPFFSELQRGVGCRSEVVHLTCRYERPPPVDSVRPQSRRLCATSVSAAGFVLFYSLLI
jgi:hypothetical protein